jgi:hypothetical protein
VVLQITVHEMLGAGPLERESLLVVFLYPPDDQPCQVMCLDRCDSPIPHPELCPPPHPPF